MRVKLSALSLDDVQMVRVWRADAPESLRTPFLLTEKMQRDFYERVISDRSSPHRYWAVREPDETLVGCVGLTNIQWDNGTAEISLIIGVPGQGYGRQAVALVLAEAFKQMRLETVTGEAYECNTALRFWQKVVAGFHYKAVTLPMRKFWGGRFYDSWWFCIFKPQPEITR